MLKFGDVPQQRGQSTDFSAELLQEGAAALPRLVKSGLIKVSKSERQGVSRSQVDFGTTCHGPKPLIHPEVATYLRRV